MASLRGFYAVALAGLMAAILPSLSQNAIAGAVINDYGDPIVARAWLDDPDSALTPQEALKKTWRPFKGMLGRGLTRSTTWLRLTIDPSLLPRTDMPGDSRWALMLLPAHLDEIEIFRADNPALDPIVVGDRYLADAPKILLPNYVIFEDDNEPIEILLRIATTANVALYPIVERWNSARDFSFGLEKGLTIYSVLVLLTALGGLYSWLKNQRLITILFVAQQFFFIFTTYYLLGMSHLSEFPWVRLMSDQSAKILVPLTSAIAIFFHAQLLSEFGARKFDTKLLRSAGFLNLVAVMIVIFGWINTGLRITQISVSMCYVFLVIVSARIRQGDMPDAGAMAAYTKAYLIAVYLLLALIMFPQFNRSVSQLYLGPWTLGSFLSHSIVATVFMGGLMIYRNNQRKRMENRRSLNSKVLEATIETQSDLINMLAHELKTPLSVIALALGREDGGKKHIRRSLDAMQSISTIIGDCEALVTAEKSALQSNPVTIDRFRLSELLIEQIERFDDGVRIALSVKEENVYCSVDSAAIGLITRNLIDNALKYSPANTEVRAAISVCKRFATQGLLLRICNLPSFSVDDDSVRKNVFKRYYRGSSAQTVSGSGIGLYLSLRAAERCSAILNVERFDSEEVCFSLWVPGSS